MTLASCQREGTAGLCQFWEWRHLPSAAGGSGWHRPVWGCKASVPHRTGLGEIEGKWAPLSRAERLPATPSPPRVSLPLAPSTAPLHTQAQRTLVQVGEGLLLLLPDGEWPAQSICCNLRQGCSTPEDVGQLFLLQVGVRARPPCQGEEGTAGFCPVHPPPRGFDSSCQILLPGSLQFAEAGTPAAARTLKGPHSAPLASSRPPKGANPQHDNICKTSAIIYLQPQGLPDCQ